MSCTYLMLKTSNKENTDAKCYKLPIPNVKYNLNVFNAISKIYYESI